MIFLSHNSRDKPLVEEIAKTLGDVFGQDKVFYDAWSIQPGDGIIEKMNEGLAACEFFFFFVSKNSLSSEMVKLEWQNALMKKNQSNIAFIPVKIDESLPPAVLLQTRYIDLFSYGLEVAKRQIIDVIIGKNTFQNSVQVFSNIVGIIDEDGLSTTVEFRAKHYMEPQSKFSIMLKNDQSEFTFKALNHSMFHHNFVPDVRIENVESCLCSIFWVDAPTSPGFPFKIKLTPKNGKKLNIVALAHAKTHDTFQFIPIE